MARGKGKGKRKGKQTHRKTTASASDPIIPWKIIHNILSRLPVKAVLRFKCVCKPWRTLISLSHFASQHISNSPPSLIIHAVEIQQPLIDQPEPQGEPECLEVQPTGHVIALYKIPNLQLNTPSDLVRLCEYPGSDSSGFHFMDVVGCPNGVVCLTQQPWARKITVWNPATRSYKPVTARPCLPADPYVHNGVSVGLGFDPSHNDYKIVRIMCHKLELDTSDEAEVYSVKHGRWRPVKTDAVFRVLKTKCELVFKGMLYWSAVGYDEYISRVLLVCFDVEKEKFHFESLAWNMNDETKEMFLGEIKGCLSVAVWDRETEISKDRIVDVWMKDDEGRWSTIYRVGATEVLGLVVGFYGDRGIVEKVGNEGNLIMYNLERMEVEDFINIEHTLPHSFDVLSYRESLARIS